MTDYDQLFFFRGKYVLLLVVTRIPVRVTIVLIAYGHVIKNLKLFSHACASIRYLVCL